MSPGSKTSKKTKMESVPNTNQDKQMIKKISANKTEEELDKKIKKYNDYDENHPMMYVSRIKSTGKYQVRYANINSTIRDLDTACERVKTKFEEKNELLILKKSQITKNILTYKDYNIVSYEYEGKLFYDIQHVLYFIGLKVTSIIKYYNNNYKKIVYKVWKKNKYGGFFVRELISTNTVKKIIYSSIKRRALILASVIGIKVYDEKRSSKENSNIESIITVFKKENYTETYTVGKYYIDLYFHEYKLAIECDENNHSDRNPAYESKRQKYIEKKLGCVFIRFNPDDPNFNILETISKIHYHMKE